MESEEAVASNCMHDKGVASNVVMQNIKNKFEGVTPYKGMLFESLEEADSYYHQYARVVGFAVRIRNTTTFSRSTEIKYRRYVCSCEGSCPKNKSDENRKKRTLTVRTGCKVSFVVSRSKQTTQWSATNVCNFHNHLLASPRSIVNLRDQRAMPSVAKNLVEKFTESGLPIGKVPDVLSDELGVNFSSRDCWNHTRNLRRKNLDLGDAEGVFSYCQIKQTHDPNFYFSIQHDEESRMVNFFWVDSRSRLCYERFGDVIVFDTTYKTNKYELPFGLFVGVNNHDQTILFGCALLQDETERSYEWLFRTWLDAMNGKAPISVLTDQDKAIGNMVRKVFPSSTHRLCLWHIMKKFPEKFGNLYKEKSPFKNDMKKCLWDSVTTEEFDKEWNIVMTRYGLQGDSWLKGLFDIRSSWVPVYNRTVFFAGMNTTQRCESMHSFFDGFVDNSTSLREFVSKYEKALLKRYKDENLEHFKSKHKHPVSTLLPISDHAASIYTRAIFTKFEDEVSASLRLSKQRLEKNGCFSRYLVAARENSNVMFSVSVDTSSWEASCECHYFEFRGLLCRHILAIFQKKDVKTIPSRYFLPRWTKEADEGIPIPSAVEADKSSLVRILEFRRKTSLLAPYLHESEEMYLVIIDGVDKILQEVQLMKSSTDEDISMQQCHFELARTPLVDPLVANTKGRKSNSTKASSNGRFRSGLELAISAAKKQKIPRKCRACGEYGTGHDTRNCPYKSFEEKGKSKLDEDEDDDNGTDSDEDDNELQ